MTEMSGSVKRNSEKAERRKSCVGREGGKGKAERLKG